LGRKYRLLASRVSPDVETVSNTVPFERANLPRPDSHSAGSWAGTVPKGGQNPAVFLTTLKPCAPQATIQQPEDDRSSHLQRGDSHGAYLAKVPFDAYMAPWEKKYLVELVLKLYTNKPDRYLDFACGTGRAAATVACARFAGEAGTLLWLAAVAGRPWETT